MSTKTIRIKYYDLPSSYNTADCINFTSSSLGLNLQQFTEDILMPSFADSNALTVLVFKRFLNSVLIRLTWEKTRSVSAFECGKTKRHFINPQRVVNWASSVPSVTVASCPQTHLLESRG